MLRLQGAVHPQRNNLFIAIDDLRPNWVAMGQKRFTVPISINLLPTA